jgi:hypothetical protein
MVSDYTAITVVVIGEKRILEDPFDCTQSTYSSREGDSVSMENALATSYCNWTMIEAYCAPLSSAANLTNTIPTHNGLRNLLNKHHSTGQLIMHH